MHGYWRHELDQFIAVFPATALTDAAVPAQATAPAAEPSKTV